MNSVPNGANLPMRDAEQEKTATAIREYLEKRAAVLADFERIWQEFMPENALAYLPYYWEDRVWAWWLDGVPSELYVYAISRAALDPHTMFDEVFDGCARIVDDVYVDVAGAI